MIKSSEFDALLSPVKEKAIALMSQEKFIREAGFALQIINGSPQLQEADKTSIMQAVYNVALTGLTLNPVLKLAYLIPRYIGGKIQAALEPSYQGLISLIVATGEVKNVYAHPIYQGDEWQIEYGTERSLIHKPKFQSQIITHFYAVAIMSDGSKQFEVMTVDEVNIIRDRSEGYKAFTAKKIKSTPWDSDYSEMGRKTPIKRLFKYLPKSEKWEKIAQAIDIDNGDYRPTWSQIDMAESLIQTSGFNDDVKEEMRLQLHSDDLTITEFEEINNQLKNNQQNKIQSGLNYNQTDINKQMDKLL